MYRSVWKRVFDFNFALILIVVLSPILLLLCVILYFNNKGDGIFFTQKRVGRKCKIFKIIKFKTMTDEYDDKGILLPDGMRLTKIGKFIRSASIDELPQLMNVLNGEMSFIGPRPLLISYLPYYTEYEQLRHSIRPGITGWAQVNGRNLLSWDERLDKDVWYVKHISFSLDIKIIWLTIMKIVKREDIVVDAHSIMKNLDEERGITDGITG